MQIHGDSTDSSIALGTLAKGLTDYFMDRYHDKDIRDVSQKTQEDEDESKSLYTSWMTRMKDTFVSLLLELCCRGGALDQVAALGCLMEFVRGKTLGVFDNVLYAKVLSVILTKRHVASETIGCIIGKYCSFADGHYFTCKAITSMCMEHTSRRDGGSNGDSSDEDDDGEENSSHDFIRIVYDVLVNITDELNGFDDEELPSWCGATEVGILAATNDGSTKRQRKRFREETSSDKQENNVSGKWSSRKLRQKAMSDAWIEFLKLNIPFDCYRSLLTKLHDTIIPALIKPILLSDFLTHALNRGGMDGMLALNGIFILVTQHGLEYPKFYERLYGLLNEDVFISKHRVRFFKLADIFLASPMVPAYTAAAFAKKFARLGIRGSPATAIIAIAFIHNIIRRHPSCVQILHRPQKPHAPSEGGVWEGVDAYDEHEPNPADSKALESSLWELSVFRNHADPAVVQYCSVLDKDITNKIKHSEIDITEVLTLSYASLFDREIKKRLKSVPTSIYSGTREGIPKSLFREEDMDLKFPGFSL